MSDEEVTTMYTLFFIDNRGNSARMYYSSQRKAELSRDVMLAEGIEKPLRIVEETVTSTIVRDTLWLYTEAV